MDTIFTTIFTLVSFAWFLGDSSKQKCFSEINMHLSGLRAFVLYILRSIIQMGSLSPVVQNNTLHFWGLRWLIFFGIFSMFTKTETLSFCGCPEHCLISILQISLFCFLSGLWVREVWLIFYIHFLLLIIVISTNFLKIKKFPLP